MRTEVWGCSKIHPARELLQALQAATDITAGSNSQASISHPRRCTPRCRHRDLTFFSVQWSRRTVGFLDDDLYHVRNKLGVPFSMWSRDRPSCSRLIIPVAETWGDCTWFMYFPTSSIFWASVACYKDSIRQRPLHSASYNTRQPPNNLSAAADRLRSPDGPLTCGCDFIAALPLV